MSIQIPEDLVPAQVGGKVTDAEYIQDGNENQHEINQKTIKGDVPDDDGVYLRKNGLWSKLDIHYEAETETLVINTEPINQ